MDSLKLEIKRLLIETLDLEDMTPADIDDDAPLFDTDGIGLDSIDALEIGIALRKQYQLTIAADDQRTREHFRSVNTLAELIQSHQSHQ
ncbi:phosphopantetheine-binding protein [Ralstonia solanacearum]|uniref:Putative acyl-carrier protein n=1 Tax=Ralstonia solanacearum CFBP2957 TaxID=859656 RepID=D8P2P8_RALSL|nr:phosphopantetheine-binding protein [Ralstonia solanacearum]AST34337.2 acyl carrier protein [Ralstonia solanacearum]MBB6592651.1 acyl carrier protein [Ralstonia solanacearum]MBB6596875.1 acyl carrier protein [Ralstonia solanacearum]MDB0510345.1 phosphopantetheine-binding protein [Ralstonia solanacearum]MDB0540716.1 phosphopantetheine-binding protein [Ralstonia solanacearum]